MGELKVIGEKGVKPACFFFGESLFSITLFFIGSEENVSVPVVFMGVGYLIHPRVRGTNLMTTCIFLEGCIVNSNKT